MNKKIISLGLAGLLSLGFLVMDYLPKLQEIFVLRREIVSRNKTVRSLSAQEIEKKKLDLAGAVEQTKNDLAWSQKTMAELKTRIQTEDNVPLFLMQLEQMVNAAQLEMVSLNPKDSLVSPGKDYKLTPFSISLQGQYSQLMAFLESFSREKTAVIFQEVLIKKEENIFPKLNCTITFQVINEPSSTGIQATEKKSGL